MTLRYDMYNISFWTLDFRYSDVYNFISSFLPQNQTVNNKRPKLLKLPSGCMCMFSEVQTDNVSAANKKVISFHKLHKQKPDWGGPREENSTQFQRESVRE